MLDRRIIGCPPDHFLNPSIHYELKCFAYSAQSTCFYAQSTSIFYFEMKRSSAFHEIHFHVQPIAGG